MTVPLIQDDSTYRDILLGPIRKCLDYKPKLGQDDEEGIDLHSFHLLYDADPLYHWMGFDSDLMYAAHKAAGGMTSLYRQLGVGCEGLFRTILRDSLGLSLAQASWSYQKVDEGRKRTLSLDGRVQLSDVTDLAAVERIRTWLDLQRNRLSLSAQLAGAVFEVRQGYKSKDAKRQNADLSNASQALGNSYLPVLAVMSTQMNQEVKLTYEVGKWAILLGFVGKNDPAISTFDFLRDVIGYDLESFFERNHEILRTETAAILDHLLAVT